MMVSFIDAHRESYWVEPICGEWPIAPWTCCEQKVRQDDPLRLPEPLKRNAELREHIERNWRDHLCAYGAPMVWHQLGRQ